MIKIVYIIIQIQKMNDLSQIEAYKQLLEVTENILNQLSPQDQIIKKYQTLKKSILSKARTNTQKSYSSIMTNSYKSFSKYILQCLTEFQSEIEGQMNKSTFLRNTNKYMKQIQKQTRNLSEELNSIMSSNESNKNIKLLIKQQINSYKYLAKEFEGKIQNMGLMIEVHRKMHEIILQASEKQAKTAHKQNQYNRRLNEMENVVDQIADVKKFIQSYEITSKKARRFELARKNLAKALFDI